MLICASKLSRMQQASFLDRPNKLLSSIYQASGDTTAVSLMIVGALKACSTAKELELGEKIHRDSTHLEFQENLYVSNSLVSMYTKCGSLEEARRVFDGLSTRDVVTWNSLIKGYVANGKPEVALKLFSCMGCEPDDLSFVAALTACSSLASVEEPKKVGVSSLKPDSLEKGFAIHSQARRTGLESSIFVASTLIDLYARCGSMVDARGVFDRMQAHDVVSWNSLILGYVDSGESELALELFQCLGSKLEPDSRAFVAALMACGSLAEKDSKMKSLQTGKTLHLRASKLHLERDVFVANALIDMYARCGSLEDCQRVFDRVLHPDVVLWNTLLLGYVENQQGERALELFRSMQAAPNARTYIAAAMAHIQLAQVEQAKPVDGKVVKLDSLKKSMILHSESIRAGYELYIFLSNTLIDLYMKCSSLLDARRVFDRMPHQDVVSWTALILGYAENGENHLALELFSTMSSSSCQANARTFVAALIACTNLADLETGRKLHHQISELGFISDPFVGNSLVDLYGKCGCIGEAKQIFESLKLRSLVAWSSLISAYTSQGSTEQVFDTFQKMCDEGIQPDGVTFLSILTACSHAGLVERGKQVFDEMLPRYGVQPGIEHYHCLIDLLGRANHILEAVNAAKSMPFEANGVTWTTVLGACQKWKNVVLGKLAFDSALRVDRQLGVAYVLMANIYGSVGLRLDQERILSLKRDALLQNED